MQQNNMGGFSGDMDRNEVEIDLNKFMELLQEKSKLKDRIRELEDIKNDNPYQKLIFVAQAIDSWRIIPDKRRHKFRIYWTIIYIGFVSNFIWCTSRPDRRLYFRHSVL